jgi:hypothetical protein
MRFARIAFDRTEKLKLVSCLVILCARWFGDTMGERIGRIGRIQADFF